MPSISEGERTVRIRTIKPGFFKDEELAELDPLTRILFAGLWCLADSEGRLEYRPKYIKAEILPYDDCDIEMMLETLGKQRGNSQCFTKKYEVGGRFYLQIMNFKKHQRITGKEAETPSEFPPPPMGLSTENHYGETTEKQSRNNRETADVQERKGKEYSETNNVSDCDVQDMVQVPESKPPVNVSKTPQARFMDGFKSSYQAMTGQPFKDDKHHYVIVSRLISKYGEEEVIKKAKNLGALCRDRSAWFTKEGWGAFTIEKLSSQWNCILTDAVETEDQKRIKAMEDARREREQSSQLMDQYRKSHSH